MVNADAITIQALRSDVALQIARCLRDRGLSQVDAALLLDVPQPTLSKIVNDRIEGLSLELLIRTAVRAGLPLVIQTGTIPAEAGAYASRKALPPAARACASRVADGARTALLDSAQRLTPEQRLNAMLEQTQLFSELRAAGRGS